MVAVFYGCLSFVCLSHLCAFHPHFVFVPISLSHTHTPGFPSRPGRETKSALNNTGSRFKRSKLESRINMDVIWCVLILAAICFTGAVGCGVWQENLPGEDVLFVALDRNVSTSSPAFQGFLNFWRFIVIFQVRHCTFLVTIIVSYMYTLKSTSSSYR
ncbi:hypothetical protein AHF37_06008 [Paragonimus kellicotti]|nr:hypothetical protein AHF37_06008 [Paragonimus kellicotti]